MEVVTDFFFYAVLCCTLVFECNRLSKNKKNVGQGLGSVHLLLIRFWGVNVALKNVLKKDYMIEKSGIHQQRDVCLFTRRSTVVILI